jgi:hypothetical protein
METEFGLFDFGHCAGWALEPGVIGAADSVSVQQSTKQLGRQVTKNDSD